MVGAITTKAEPNPLPSDLESFINSAGGHGFIIASFGSYTETLIFKEKTDVLAEAFGKLKQKVVWKLKGNLDMNTLYAKYHLLLVCCKLEKS